MNENALLWMALFRLIAVPRKLQDSSRSQHVNLNNKGNPKNDSTTLEKIKRPVPLAIWLRSHSAYARLLWALAYSASS